MKHSRYLPRAACDDDGCSSPFVSDGRRAAAAALKEMAREQSLVTPLRAVVLPALQQAGDERSEVVAQMFETILDCSAKAIAALKLHRLDYARGDHGAQLPAVVDDKKSVRKISDGCGLEEEDNAKRNRQPKRRRLADDSVRLETPVPHYHGHQWRKYGQKLINNEKHPRSYYRCTYKQEQACRATKTVQQQQQQQDNAADDTVMYAVVYYGQHTCKPRDTDAAAAAVETASTGHSSGVDDELTRSDSLSQCSNISVTRTSVLNVMNHHHRTTTSLESNSKLLDMAEDVTTAVVNKDELFDDMGACTPLDFDTVWRWMRMDMDMGS